MSAPQPGTCQGYGSKADVLKPWERCRCVLVRGNEVVARGSNMTNESRNVRCLPFRQLPANFFSAPAPMATPSCSWMLAATEQPFMDMFSNFQKPYRCSYCVKFEIKKDNVVEGYHVRICSVKP